MSIAQHGNGNGDKTGNPTGPIANYLSNTCVEDVLLTQCSELGTKMGIDVEWT